MIVSVFPSPAANTTLIRPLPSIPTLRKLPSAKLVGSGIAIAFSVNRWLFDLPFKPDWIEVAAMPIVAALIASLAALLAAQAALRIRPAAGLRTL